MLASLATSLDLAQRAFRWLGRHELGFILALVMLPAGAAVFLKVAGEVREGDTQSLDRLLLLALRDPRDVTDPLGPVWFEEMVRDFTALGGVGVLTLITIAVIGYLLLERKIRAAAFVAFSIAGAALLSTVLKGLFARPRPDVVPHLALVTSPSFPSGHSMLSAAVYLTLGALLARFQERVLVRAYLLSLALLVAVLVGASRVYIGVHWPSDVLAGWAAGAAWAALCWVLARGLQRRGEIDG